MSIAGQYRRAMERAARRTSRALVRPLSRGVITGVALTRGRAVADRRATVRGELDRLPCFSAVDRSITLIVVADGRSGGGAPRGPRPPLGPRVTTVVVEPTTSGGATARRHRTRDSRPVAARVTELASGADTDLICVLRDTSEPLSPDWLACLAAEVDGQVAAATPLLLHPERPPWRATPDDLLVRSLGVRVVDRAGGPLPGAAATGSRPDLAAAASPVDAMSSACVVVDRARFLDAGALPSLDSLDAAMIELSIRLRLDGHQIVGVPAAAMIDHRPVRSADAMQHVLDPDGRGWRQLVDRTGPLLLRAERSAPAHLAVAITTAAPSARVALRWGDWHLAEALARSLRGLGHGVRVQSIADVDQPASRAANVQLVVRGKSAVRRTSGQRHVLWVISHPDLLTIDECNEADLVLVASTRFADQLAERTSTPVAALLQATDVARFHPRPPDPRWAHPVAIVANARHTLRPIVADALAAGLRPAIVGRGWDRLIDPDLVVAEQVTNEELSTVYSSIGVLLNDHWVDMRTHGFVSNRVFDALACATPVISDHLPELADLFGAAVATYRDPAELRDLVDEALADPPAARARSAAARRDIVARHTFDHRAAELLGQLADHDLLRPPG